MSADRHYRRLMVAGGPGDAFDRHLLASAVAAAAAEAPDRVADGLGLSQAALARLLAERFPRAERHYATGDGGAPASPEEPDLRALLAAHASGGAPESGWLAHVVARRCLRPNHLWQDLGLRGRSELSALMRRHFAPLAAANDRDMKWKKFLYRRLCQDEGVMICKSPVCDDCSDFALCFGPEDGDCRVPDTPDAG